jgi:tetratricopeptide (TPR) repeat protein
MIKNKNNKKEKMKKTILTITTVAIASLSYAQKAKVVSAYNYNKAFERSQKCSELKEGLDAINMAIDHEQTKEWAKTWYYRGNLYFNILASKDACKDIDAEALDKATDSYMKALVLNFEDPELKKLDLEKEDGSDIMKFYGALQNKSKVDDEMYTMDIMGRKLPGLAVEHGNAGIDKFQNKDYAGAKESFGKSLMLNQLGGKLDTMMMYNTALAAEYSDDTETAKQIYDGLIMMKYNIDGNGPNLYRSQANLCKKEGNEEKAAEYIKKGRAAYPSDYNLIVAELDGYLKEQKYEEALQNLNLAIENNSSNEVLYFARGTVYEALKNEDNAVADYKKAIELKPNYFDAVFNLGAYYFNKGADKVNEANALPYNETKKFDAVKAEAKVAFEASIPHIEKANEIKPEDVDTANMLIKVYTQTEQYDKAKAIKAKYQ